MFVPSLNRHARREPATRREIGYLAVLVCLFALEYALYGLFRHWHFGSDAYDLGIFDQVIWHLSRFEAPASSIRGLSNIWGDHFHPVIALFAPLYWVAPGPETLIVTQAVLFSASLVPVYLFLRDRLAAGPSLALCGAYGLFWAVQRAAVFDVHEVAFAPLLIATALLAMDRRRWALFFGAAVGLMLVKEDLIPLVTCFGLYLLLVGEWRRGAVVTMASLLLFVLVMLVVIPSLNDFGQYGYSGAYASVLRSPWNIPAALVTPAAKLRTVLLWLAPFVFLPLFSPFSVLLGPLVLSRLLSENPTHWGTAFHYSVPLAPILVMSAGDALSRIASRIEAAHTRRRVVAGLTGACVLLSLFLPGNQPLWDLFEPGHYRGTSVDRTGRRALQAIPPDASVVAQSAIVPHLSQRARAYVLDAKAPDADFVIAAANLSPWPNGSPADVRTLLDARRARGYIVVFDEQGWIVLRRR